MSLDRIDRPFIYAYSSYINDDVRKKTAECGFDRTLEEQLSVHSMNLILQKDVFSFVNKIVN